MKKTSVLLLAAPWLLAAIRQRLRTTPLRSRTSISADDIGYGDFGCYGATKVKTPNFDRLAARGPCASPTRTRRRRSARRRATRFMTGEYAWRKKAGAASCRGDAALIIEPGRVTVPSLLKQAGYTTGVVGKWHLGLGTGDLDWNGEIKPGPLEIGFDYAFLIPATGDRVPCVFVENHRVVGLDPRTRSGQLRRKVGDEPTGSEIRNCSR